MVAILSNQREAILGAVQAMYTEVASHPERVFHFPTGRSACEFVGYPGERLDPLPGSAVESFAGVGYPFAANAIDPGDTVLDIGSGSGTDALIASRLAGPRGSVIALDLTRAMLRKLERNVALAGATNVRPLEGEAERIPLPDASVDVVTSNGVLNLVPDKARAIGEIHRVLRPGGRVQVADIVLGAHVPDECRTDPKLWAECIVGAMREEDYLALFRSAGFERVEALGHLDYFAGSASPETRGVAASLHAHAVVMWATKPPVAADRTPSPWPARSAARDAPEPAPTPQPHAVYEAYGKPCGVLEPLLKLQMRELESGQILEVRSDEPAARLGIPAWSRLAGHALVGVVEDPGCTRFLLRKR